MARRSRAAIGMYKQGNSPDLVRVRIDRSRNRLRWAHGNVGGIFQQQSTLGRKFILDRFSIDVTSVELTNGPLKVTQYRERMRSSSQVVKRPRSRESAIEVSSGSAKLGIRSMLCFASNHFAGIPAINSACPSGSAAGSKM